MNRKNSCCRWESYLLHHNYGLRLVCVCLSYTISLSRANDRSLQYPLAVVAQNETTIYVADLDLPGIWSCQPPHVKVFYKGSPQFRTPLNRVRCLAYDPQLGLLAGDTATREIYRFDALNEPQPLTYGRIGMPMCMAIARDGTIYASDIERQRIVKIPRDGGSPKVVVEISAVRGLAFDAEGHLWAATQGPNALYQIPLDGSDPIVKVPGRAFKFSHHLVFDAHGWGYVADGYSRAIWRFQTQNDPVSPEMIQEFSNQLKNPVGLDWHPAWGLLIADPHLKTVFRWKPPDGELEPIIPAR